MSDLLIETGRGDAIRLSEVSRGEMPIALGEMDVGVDYKDYFSYSSKDVINIHQAEQIITHLQQQFNL
jgi:hypothetical protein